ncbi:MAG TPA: radical SAM protein, partial [Candidatus Nitrosotalea sp.]|nr:radical SAM protein [Candidatus Nitrosotalea sp.]
MYLTRRMKRFRAGPNAFLVTNAITGEIAVMNSAGISILDSLAADERPTAPVSFVEALIGKQFLFGSREEEQAAFEETCQTSFREFRRSVPRHYTFILNSHCNFNCRYCFERPEYRERVATLSTEQIDAAFRVIDRYSTRHGKHEFPGIEIFGGEPLLPKSRPSLEWLLRAAAKRGLMAAIQTNGFHVASFLDFFRTFGSHIRQIQVTLDGPPA